MKASRMIAKVCGSGVVALALATSIGVAPASAQGAGDAFASACWALGGSVTETRGLDGSTVYRCWFENGGLMECNVNDDGARCSYTPPTPPPGGCDADWTKDEYCAREDPGLVGDGTGGVDTVKEGGGKVSAGSDLPGTLGELAPVVRSATAVLAPDGSASVNPRP